MMNEEQVRELFNLDEIRKIVNVLGRAGDKINFQEDKIQVLDKEYSILKDREKLIIKCADGRQLVINLFFSSEEAWDCRHGSYETHSNKVSCEYFLSNGNKIGFISGDLGGFDTGYGTMERLNLSTLINVNFNFYNQGVEGIAWISFTGPGGKDVRVKLVNKHLSIIYIDEEHVVCKNRILSRDGQRILKNGSMIVPEIEVVRSFDVIQEREKIMKMLSDTTLHEFTRKIIDKALENLDLQAKETDEIIADYDERIVPECQKLLGIYNEFVEGLEKWTFNQEELSGIALALEMIVNQKIFEQAKKQVQNQEKVKKLIRSLSDSELETLKKTLK